MSAGIKKLKKTALAGIAAGTLLSSSGCGTILNHNDYYATINAPENLNWEIYKTTRGDDKRTLWKTGKGNSLILLDKASCPDYEFFSEKGHKDQLKCGAHPTFFLNLFLGLPPICFIPMAIDTFSGGAASYESKTINFYDKASLFYPPQKNIFGGKVHNPNNEFMVVHLLRHIKACRENGSYTQRQYLEEREKILNDYYNKTGFKYKGKE